MQPVNKVRIVTLDPSPSKEPASMMRADRAALIGRSGTRCPPNVAFGAVPLPEAHFAGIRAYPTSGSTL
jgi:hypothetical protein